MKADIVSAIVSSIQSAQSQALIDGVGQGYDAGLASAPPSLGGLTQADVDAQVKAQSDSDASALAASQAADAKAQADAVASVQAQLDAATQALADMTAKDQKDSAAVLALKASAAGLQSVLDQLNAIINPPAALPADPSATPSA